MRIALARLRTAISFFSLMVADSQQRKIRAELKWLHAELGAVRDLDVVIGRLEAANQQRPHDYRPWKEKRAQAYRRLARALRSARYRRLIKNASDWIENGPWSTNTGKHASKERASPMARTDRRIARLTTSPIPATRTLRPWGRPSAIHLDRYRRRQQLSS
jgi:CHAD domain-containing protein